MNRTLDIRNTRLVYQLLFRLYIEDLSPTYSELGALT